MKRDFDVIRAIMLLVEENESAEPVQFPELMEKIPGYGVQFMGYQIDQAAKAGLIEGETIGYPVQAAVITGLTPTGHDFLDAARSDSVWKKGKEKLLEVGGSTSLEIFKALLLQIAKAQLGLP